MADPIAIALAAAVREIAGRRTLRLVEGGRRADVRVLSSYKSEAMPPGQMAVRVALARDESPEQLAGDEAEIPGLGRRRIVRVRYTDSPEPGLLPGERVYALDVAEPA